MMEQNDDKLFRLIQSMTKAEKSFFKKYSSIHNTQKEPHYLALYEVIEKLQFYQEKQLLNKHKGAGFTTNFAATKAYLFETILKSLLAFKAGKDPGQMAEQYLIEAEILMDRLIYNEAIKYIQKGKELAHSINHNILIFRFLELERTLYGIYQPQDHSNKKKRIIEEIQNQLNNL